MIGVYGGTFDPIHYGHLRTALEVKELYGLDEVRLIPCNSPPHREQPKASAEMRLQMLRLAVENEPGLVIDTRELERDGPSYMVDTLKSLRGEVDSSSVFLFIGGTPGIAAEIDIGRQVGGILVRINSEKRV